MNVKGFKIVLAVLTFLQLMQTVRAGSVQESVRGGNRLYRDGNFSEAIKEYDQALIDAPAALEPKFNKANSYYRLDDLGAALDLYREVATESKDMKLVADAKYNLGNTHFKQGIRQKDSNLQKALDELQTSIGYWRQVLDTDPENERAAKNIEVARLIIKDVIDQINKQKQQQQEQAAKQQQLQEKLKELLEQQEALSERTEATEEQADKGEISEQQAADAYGQQANEQSQLKDRTQQTSEQVKQQDPNNPQPPQMQQAAEELDNAAAKQADAQERLDASDGALARQAQDKAVEHIENALKALSQRGQQEQGQQQQGQQEEQQRFEQEPNQPEDANQQAEQQQQMRAPDTTAEEILDKEQRQRKERQILQRPGWQKVEKDW